MAQKNLTKRQSQELEIPVTVEDLQAQLTDILKDNEGVVAYASIKGISVSAPLDHPTINKVVGMFKAIGIFTVEHNGVKAGFSSIPRRRSGKHNHTT